MIGREHVGICNAEHASNAAMNRLPQSATMMEEAKLELNDQNENSNQQINNGGLKLSDLIGNGSSVYDCEYPTIGASKSREFEETIEQEAGSHRFTIALLGLTIAAVNCYAQATFCIAIVEMVLPADFLVRSESSQSVVMRSGATSVINVTEPIAFEDHSCPIEYKYRDYYDSWRFLPNGNTSAPASTIAQANTNLLDLSDRFDWDASRQGLLLGAFAVGTAPLQVLGGRLAEIYGAKWVLLAGCIGTALTNLTIPLIARFSFTLLLINRVLMGIAQAGMEPGLMCLLAEWLTPAETGFFISMLLFAICIGFFLGSLCSSFILTIGYGWPLAYYVSGGLNLLVGLVWLFYASSRPSESRLISVEELGYIETSKQLIKKKHDGNCDLNTTTNWNISSPPSLPNEPIKGKDERSPIDYQVIPVGAGQAPWMNILRTRSVWAFIICKISIRWAADVLGIELPSYLANVLHLSIKLNGILNSVSSALFAIFSFITGYLVNEILKSQMKETDRKVASGRSYLRISKTNLRKLIQSGASFGSAICMCLMTRYDCNILLSMAMLLILSCCLVMGTGGELQIPYDMTSRYPGTVHGLACSMSVSGWLAPPLIGLILGDQPNSRYRWNIVWYLTALINLIGGLVFVLFADASPRDFDQPPAKVETKRCQSDEEEADGALECEEYATDNRGRHANLDGYYNAACKSSADTSPINSERRLRSGSPQSKGAEFTDSPEGKQQELDWSSHFDRDLIKCRQVEESFIVNSTGYLHNRLDSLAAQPVIFPYRLKRPTSEQLAPKPSDQRPHSSPAGLRQPEALVRRLLALFRARRAHKFSLKGATVEPAEHWRTDKAMARQSGRLQTDTSQAGVLPHHADGPLANGNPPNATEQSRADQQLAGVAVLARHFGATTGTKSEAPMTTKTITHL